MQFRGRRGSSGPTRASWLRVAVPAAVVLLSIVAVIAIAGLLRHANAGRDADDRLDEVAISFNQLQGLPWKLITPGGGTRAQIHAQIASSERRITEAVRGLRRSSPIPQLDRLSALLARNFTIQSEIMRLLETNDVDKTGPLGFAAFETHDAATRAIDSGSEAYRDQSKIALIEAVAGSAAVVLVLLLGFGIVYRRAYRERAAAEELASELTLSEAHLQKAQRLAAVGSWEWTVMPDGGVSYSWSEEQRRLHGWTGPGPPRTIGDAAGLLDPEDAPRVVDELTSAFTERRCIDTQYRVAHGDRLIHLQGRLVIGPDGRPTGMMGTCQDVTERFRRVEAERANRAKSEFVSRISHELRTPLNAILGFGQLLGMSELDARQKGNVDHILTAGKHLLELINEILDISRIESDQLRLSLEPVEVTSAIHEAAALVGPIATASEIEITSYFQEPTTWVLADAQRLKQVLLNLLSNAVKYNRPGGHVEVRVSRPDDRLARIDVVDDGPGIAPSMLGRLFSPFERLGAEQGGVEGTGLGLALSQGMIEAMGGTIEVQSELARGTAFTVELQATESIVLDTGQMVPALSEPASGAVA
jgi:signal transduction histidine kinase